MSAPSFVQPEIGSSSGKRKKYETMFSTHPETIVPVLKSPTAQAKYPLLMYHVIAGLLIPLSEYPELYVRFKNIGWECLIEFSDRLIYPQLIADFYSNMQFKQDFSGNLFGFTTFVQNKEIFIDEKVIVDAFHLDTSVLNMPKCNGYVFPLAATETNCIQFKHNLSIACEQLIPADLFDMPTKIDSEFLTKRAQYLSKILKKNVMPCRTDKSLEPFDLELLKYLPFGEVQISLSYFLLTSFKQCYDENFMGFGLLLSSLFKHFNMDLTSARFQLIRKTRLEGFLTLPPRPLFMFKFSDVREVREINNLDNQLINMSDMQQLIVGNQALIMQQLGSLENTVAVLTSSVTNLEATVASFLHIQPFYAASTMPVPPSTSLGQADPLPDLGPAFSDFPTYDI